MRQRRSSVGATFAFGIVAAAGALFILCSTLLIGMSAHSLVQLPGPLEIPTVPDLPTATVSAPHRPPTATATTSPCRAAVAPAAPLSWWPMYPSKPPAPTHTPTPGPTATPSPSPSPTPTQTPVPPAPCGP